MQNEINNLMGALRVSTRSASGHSGTLERRSSLDGATLSCSSALSASSHQLSHLSRGLESSSPRPCAPLAVEDRPEGEGVLSARKFVVSVRWTL